MSNTNIHKQDDDSLAPPLPPLPRNRDSDVFSDAQGDTSGGYKDKGYNDPYSQSYEGHDQVNVLHQQPPHSAVPHQVRRESEGQWSEGDSEVLLLEKQRGQGQGWRQG
jgi:hypothetical protein